MKKTIKEIAEELGVSKTAVRKKMTDEVKTKFAETVSGTIYIAPEGINIIKSLFKKNESQTKFAEVSENQFTEVSSEVSTVIELLKEELKSKNSLIEEQQKSIHELTMALENTTSSLQAAQALHAGTMQKQLKSTTGETLPEDTGELMGQERKKRPSFLARIFGSK